jgi:hypothetical protein
VMFLPWYNFSGGKRLLFLLRAGGHPLPITGTAWHAYSNTSLLLVLLAVVALAMAGVTATQQKINFPLAAAATGLGLLVTVVIIYKLFGHRPGGNKYSEVAIGGYLGLLALIGITVGAFLTAREDGVSWERPPAAETSDSAAGPAASGGDPSGGSAASGGGPDAEPEAPPRGEH